MNSFSVCALVREPAYVIQTFIKHYQQLGAEQIFLYFDGPSENVEDGLAAIAGHPKVSLTFCDDAFWCDISGSAPSVNEAKQSCVFRHTIDQSKADWLLFCDADELVVGTTAFGAVLDQIPNDIHGVRLRNTEAVRRADDDFIEPFGSKFERRPFPKGFWGRFVLPILIYGRDWRLLSRGTTGYIIGKHLLRKGIEPDTIGAHTSILEGQSLAYLHDILPQHLELRMLHYDAVSFERWLEKWQSRLSGSSVIGGMAPARQKQLSEIGKAIDKGRETELFRRYNSLNCLQYFFLSRLGLVNPIEFETSFRSETDRTSSKSDS